MHARLLSRRPGGGLLLRQPLAGADTHRGHNALAPGEPAGRDSHLSPPTSLAVSGSHSSQAGMSWNELNSPKQTHTRAVSIVGTHIY